MIYKELDSDNRKVRNPVWWAYDQYVEHLQEHILAAYPAVENRWADAAATVDPEGRVINLISVNKDATTRRIDFRFDLPRGFNGDVLVWKPQMTKGGSGEYGSPFAPPVIRNAYSCQTITLQPDKKLRYAEDIPPQTICYYTLRLP